MISFNSKASISAVALTVMFHLVIITRGDFTVQVRTYSYSNPSESCAICIGSEGISDHSPRCCDSEITTCIGLVTHCDTFFRYCLRPLGSSNTTTSGCTGSIISDINEDDPPIDFLQPKVLGLKNPLSLRGSTAEWNGIQLFIEVSDRDPINNFDDIIDRFFLNILPDSTSLGTESPRTKHSGTFMLAEMELSIRVDCAENFAGPNCSECEAGYTGPFCQTDIDECQGVNCSGRGQCVDSRNTFTCNCEPGFTGELCETKTPDDEAANSGNNSIWDRFHFGVYVGIGAGIIVVVMIVLLVLVTVVVLVKNNNKKKKQKKDSKPQDDYYEVKNQAYDFTYKPEDNKSAYYENEAYNQPLQDNKTTALFPLEQEESKYRAVYEVIT